MRLFFLSALAAGLFAQQAQNPSPQNPSPMVEHSRPHPRLAEPPGRLPGRHEKLTAGTLFIPEAIARRKHARLFVHFHGGPLVPELAAATLKMAVISVQTGSGSGVYAKQFQSPALFGDMLREAAEKSGLTFDSVTLSAWSAGHGAIREILAVPEYYARVGQVLLIDGLHTGYAGGKPGPLEPKLEPDHLEIFLKFAKDAVAGRKTMLITHSEIFPGTFASTTETADWLLDHLGLKAQPRLRPGPMGTQQLSETQQGRLRVLGFAGNTAPDHVDQLHALAVWLREMR